MAAPEVPKSKANANLNKLVSKEKSTKPSQKHVLCTDKHPWPRLPKPLEESILLKLSEILKAVPNIFKSTKDTNKNEKARIRAQLQIGTSSVLRALEQNDLLCVLVSGKATPAITVDHVISLARDRSCPLLCLDGLSTTLASALNSKSLPLCIGFRKVRKDEPSDFADVISLVTQHAPILQSSSADKGSKAQSCSSQQLTSSMAKPCLPSKGHGKLKVIHINSSDEISLLAEIKRVFSEALVEAPQLSGKKARKKKKQKGRRNIKDVFNKYLHCQFEAGKRTVTGAIERGRLEVVLASQEAESLVSGSPLLQEQFSKCPPVILPGLTTMLRALTSGSCCFSFLGLKKLSLLPPNSRQDFKKAIEICHQSRKGVEGLKPVSGENSEAKVSVLKTESSTMDLEDSNRNKIHQQSKIAKNEQTNVEIDEKEEGKGAEEEEDEEEEEEDDYSYLYILKKDSKDLADLRLELRSEVEKSKKATAFSSDFISFSPAQKNSTTNIIGKTNKGRNLQAVNQTDSKPILLPQIKEKNETEYGTGNVGMQLKPEPKRPTNSDFISFSVTDESVKSNNTLVPVTGARQMANKTSDDVSNSMNFDETSHRMTVGEGEEQNVAEAVENKKDASIGHEKPTKEANSSVMFLMDRSGDGSNATVNSDGKKGTLQKDYAVGEEDLHTPKGKEGIDYLALDEAVRNKHKTKSLKRKLNQEEGFISFKYTEANIRTMVSNPSKKRKKKKKK